MRLDLAGLSFIDSTGLTCLLHIDRAVAAAGGHTVLLAPSPPVQRLLDITGIGRILSVHPGHRPARPAPSSHSEQHGASDE